MLLKKMGLIATKENIISLAIIIVLEYALFNGAVFAIWDSFSLPGKSIVDLVLFFLESAIIIYALLYLIRENFKAVFIAYFSVLVAYIITLLIFSENMSVLLSTVKSLFLFCIPASLFAQTLENYGLLLRMLEKMAPIMVLCGYLYGFLTNDYSYSMWLGYQLMLPLLVLINECFDEGVSVWKCILVFLCLLLVVLKASRGPLLIAIVYFSFSFFVYRIQPKKGSSSHYSVNKFSFILAVFIIVVLVVVLINLKQVMTFLYELFLSFGMDIRTLRVLAMDNALQYVSGRDLIYPIAIDLILQEPIIGYGIAGDRLVLGRALGLPIEQYTGIYAHNIILELLLHYGILLGSTLCILFLFIIVRNCFFVETSSEQGKIYSIVVIYAVILSMLSASYLITPIIWFAFGMAIKSILGGKNSEISLKR